MLSKDDVSFGYSGIITEHPRFSCEYPTTFGFVGLNKIGDIYLYSENFTQVQFFRIESGNLSSSRSLLFVTVFKSEPNKYKYSVPIATLDWVLNNSTGKCTLEIYNVTIAKADAKYFKCFLTPSQNSNDLYLIAYFKYGGFHWEICMMTFKDLANQAEKEFDHIINSFKILKE